jgi:hypothetical protein
MDEIRRKLPPNYSGGQLPYPDWGAWGGMKDQIYPNNPEALGKRLAASPHLQPNSGQGQGKGQGFLGTFMNIAKNVVPWTTKQLVKRNTDLFKAGVRAERQMGLGGGMRGGEMTGPGGAPLNVSVETPGWQPTNVNNAIKQLPSRGIASNNSGYSGRLATVKDDKDDGTKPFQDSTQDYGMMNDIMGGKPFISKPQPEKPLALQYGGEGAANLPDINRSIMFGNQDASISAGPNTATMPEMEEADAPATIINPETGLMEDNPEYLKRKKKKEAAGDSGGE